jgi:hypothetical protein
LAGLSVNVDKKDRRGNCHRPRFDLLAVAGSLVRICQPNAQNRKVIAKRTPPELADRSLVRTLSSLKNASASSNFLAAKGSTGLRSASIVKIESDSGSIISSPSAHLLLRPCGPQQDV